MNRLKEIRKQKKLSGPYVSEKINISTAYLYDLEKEKKRLNDELILKFCDLYNVTADYLLGIENKSDVQNSDPYTAIIVKAKDSDISPEKLDKLIEILRNEK